MKILCDVNQRECILYGIDAPSSTVKIEVNPKDLTEQQRVFLADELYQGLRFPKREPLNICPPTIEGFLAAIDIGLESDRLMDEAEKADKATRTYGFSSEPSEETKAQIMEVRRRFIKIAVEKMEHREAKDAIPF